MRARLTTTQRGLGNAHQQERRRQIAALLPGAPCPRCGLPMYATPAQASRAAMPPKLWHLDLDDYPGRIYGGPQIKRLAHRYCNRRAGQRIATARRTARRRAAAYTRW
jgi:hypothetical protein